MTVGKYVKQYSSGSGDNGLSPVWPDKEFELAFPALSEFLALTAWEDGSVRATGTIMLFCDGGRLKCCVNDRDGGRVAFLTAPTLDELLMRLEDGLVQGMLDWRPVRGPTAGRRGK